MRNENLGTYLNDHLAGSVTALELVDHLVDSDINADLKIFLKNLRREIQEDQEILQKLMNELGILESKFKNATAWVMEKAGRIKLHALHDADLGVLQSMESLQLGITGKKGLWTVLPALGHQEPALRQIDFPRLEMRARQQCDAVESKRLEAARKILCN